MRIHALDVVEARFFPELRPQRVKIKWKSFHLLARRYRKIYLILNLVHAVKRVYNYKRNSLLVKSIFVHNKNYFIKLMINIWLKEVQMTIEINKTIRFAYRIIRIHTPIRTGLNIFNPQTAHFTWATSNCTLVRIGISATSNLYISIFILSNKKLCYSILCAIKWIIKGRETLCSSCAKNAS